MDDEIAESYLLDSILTLVDAKHGDQQLDDRQEARRQVGFADQIFISKTDLVDDDDGRGADPPHQAHEPARAADAGAISARCRSRRCSTCSGFNLNAKLDIDPDFLKDDEHGHDHDHDHDHDHEHGEHCDHPHHHAHDDDVKSFVFRADKAFDPAKLEDFLGAIVQVYGPKMLRYKGVLNMKGTDRKVIFQGVHQLMGSDLGPEVGARREEGQQDGLHRHRPAAATSSSRAWSSAWSDAARRPDAGRSTEPLTRAARRPWRRPSGVTTIRGGRKRPRPRDAPCERGSRRRCEENP